MVILKRLNWLMVVVVSFVSLACSMNGGDRSKLYPINKDFLDKVRSTSTIQIAYWLNIPSVGKVFIVMYDATAQPSLSLDGKANFYYGTESLHATTNTYIKLPPYLYHWWGLKTAEAKNQPSVGAIYVPKTENNEIVFKRSTGDKAQWDPSNRLSQGFSVHPFPIIAVLDMSSASAASSSASSSKDEKTAKEKQKKSSDTSTATAASARESSSEGEEEMVDQFTFVISNILDEGAYARYSVDKTKKMDLTERQKLFDDAFESRRVFKKKDIVALQEYDVAKHILKATKPSAGSLQMLEFPKKYRTQNKIVMAGDLLTGVNKEKFKEISNQFNFFKTKDATGNGFLVLILETVDSQKKRFGVINTHLRFGNIQLRLDQFKEIIDYMSASKIDAWLVCGDLNTDAFNSDEYSALMALAEGQGLEDIQSAESRPDTMYDTQAVDARTKDKKKYKAQYAAYDYVFYTKSVFDVVKKSYYPEDDEELLTHGREDDTKKKYFSDHKTINVKFEFKTSTASAASASSSAAASSSSSSSSGKK